MAAALAIALLPAISQPVALCDPPALDPGDKATDTWPAESFADAQNLTAGGMDSDVSGACWNAAIASLYVVRQDRRVWRLVESGGTFVVAGAWTNLPTGADLEAITQVDENDAYNVYLLHEDDGTVYQVDLLASPPALVHQWRLTLGGYMPVESSGDGPEALTFVPDTWLAASGFVDAGGTPYVSRNGMGGLMFVGHQSGGHVYVFDVNPNANNTFTFVGDYPTNRSEIAGLEFDRDNGLLYVWHNAGGGTTWNELEVMSLSPFDDGGVLKLTTLRTYAAPPGAQSLNMEGIALARGAFSCENALRDFFVTIDGGGSQALMRFREFPCDCDGNGADDGDEADDIAAFVATLLGGSPATPDACVFDCTGDGLINGDDVACYALRIASN